MRRRLALACGACDGTGAMLGQDAELMVAGYHRVGGDLPIAMEDLYRVAPPLDFDPLPNQAEGH